MQMENQGDSDVLDAAALRQQRRLKQAIRFLHRDSADLLPLDGLKKLGTSKQGQPHHILQKRLLEAELAREGLNMRGLTPNRGVLLSRNESEEEEDFIHVACTCFGQEVKVLIDTGCKLNLISSLTVERLGLKELIEENKMEMDGFPFQRNLCVAGRIKELSLTIGQLRIISSFVIVGSTELLMSLGSKTLKSLKCVIDTDKQMLVFGTTVREQVHFTKKPLRESHSGLDKDTAFAEFTLWDLVWGTV
ncbi:nuclear receptor-interacting protein 3-like [Xenentodon cancila]